MGQQERSEKCIHSAGIIERNVDGGRSLFYPIHQASANFLIPACFLEAWSRQLFKHSNPGLKFQDQAN